MYQGAKPKGPHLRPVAEVRRFAALRAISALMLREMDSTYGRSPLGYLWAILEPVAGIALLSVVFSLGFRSPPMGSNFPIFYATGLVPFMMYMTLSNNIMIALLFSRNLMAYPRITFADALFARFILGTLTQILVAYIVLAGLVFMFDTRTAPDLPRIASSLSMAACLALGIGTLNCFIVGMIPSWQRVWAILNRPLFLISCIFFLFETLPEQFQNVLWYNPLVHIVGEMRRGFYPYYDAPYVDPLYVYGLSCGTFIFGMLFLRRYARVILHL